MESPKVIIITQARVGSTRFPGKVLKKIGDLSMLAIHLRRIKGSQLASGIVLATTFEEGVERVIQIGVDEDVMVSQGSTNDVLDRFYQAAKDLMPDYVVRLTADCPLIDPLLIDELIRLTIQSKVDYCSNTILETFPDGQDIEVISWNALEVSWRNAKLLSEREHVTPYIRKNTDLMGGNLFKAAKYHSDYNYNNIRMTVDEPSDFEAIKLLTEKLGLENDWKAYADYIVSNPAEFQNQAIIRNEGYLKSLQKDS